MKNYSEPFWIEGPRGNNAFSYEERGERPRLFVPAIVEGTLGDAQSGEEVVFADRDENGVLQSCVGLKHFVRSSFGGVPLILMDNHNHAFYFWMEAWLAGRLGDGAFLVHIDGHKDMREPPELFSGQTLEDAFDYTNFVLNVGNYIVPAMKAGLVKEAQFVTSEAELLNGAFFEAPPKILNVDLDFFAPELSYIDFEKAQEFILRHAKNAVLITVCTSPFFIDQERALQRLKDIFGGSGFLV